MGGTTGYYITRRGALNLLEMIDKESIRNGIDWVMFKCAANKTYYCSPFLAFADCVQAAGGKPVDSDIQTVYDGVGYRDEGEWLAEELKYWGCSGVKGRFEGMPCEEDEKSRARCVEVPSKETVLGGIVLFKDNAELHVWLDEYPVHWYTVGKYIISVPDNLLSNDDLRKRSFRGHLNRRALLE
jgi:hypothetical protein